MEPTHISNLLPELKNQAPAKQELISSGTGSGLAVAIQSPKIRDTGTEELKKALRMVMLKIGIRHQNLPDDLEKKVLIDHITRNYGGHHVDEIVLAFDMAICGRLTDPSGGTLDANCYENFSCLYFSKVMNAYRQWAEQEIRAVIAPEGPQIRFLTQDELDDIAREDAERQYQLFLRGYRLRGESINAAILEKDGLLANGEKVIEFFDKSMKLGKTNIYKKVSK